MNADRVLSMGATDGGYLFLHPLQYVGNCSRYNVRPLSAADSPGYVAVKEVITGAGQWEKGKIHLFF